MKINDLASKSNTEYELRDPSTNEKLGVTFYGFTPDSEEWEKARKSVAKTKAKKKQSLYIESKTGDTRIDVDNEEAKTNGERQIKLIAKITTRVEGIDDFESDEISLIALFQNPKYKWMYDQWFEWLDDRGNWFGTIGE